MVTGIDSFKEWFKGSEDRTVSATTAVFMKMLITGLLNTVTFQDFRSGNSGIPTLPFLMNMKSTSKQFSDALDITVRIFQQSIRSSKSSQNIPDQWQIEKKRVNILPDDSVYKEYYKIDLLP